jgi:hypothetical protein
LIFGELRPGRYSRPPPRLCLSGASVPVGMSGATLIGERVTPICGPGVGDAVGGETPVIAGAGLAGAGLAGAALVGVAGGGGAGTGGVGWLVTGGGASLVRVAVSVAVVVGGADGVTAGEGASPVPSPRITNTTAQMIAASTATARTPRTAALMRDRGRDASGSSVASGGAATSTSFSACGGDGSVGAGPRRSRRSATRLWRPTASA